MKLHPPFKISSRLMPALRIGDAWISLSLSGKTTADGRDIYEAYIDLPDGTEYAITDLRSGCQGGSVQEGMHALLDFLYAAAESRNYRERQGKAYDPDDDTNEGLFESAIVDWAAEHAGDIIILACKLDENPDLIED